MRTLLTLLAAATIVAVGAVGFVYSGLYDVSAGAPHSGPVQWLLSKTSDAAIARRAASINVPDIRSEALAQAGINDYEAMCAECHGSPGRSPSPLAQGLNPPAPDLAESAQTMSPAELFWVTKHGIKMTGMPAWGASHDDASLWPVVAFLTRLPGLDGESYEQYLAMASGKGHHAPESPASRGHGHDHGEPERPESGGHDHDSVASGDHGNDDASHEDHYGHDHEHEHEH